MGFTLYLLRRLLNYLILIFIAVSLAYILAAARLDPRSLYEMRQPPLDPATIDRLLDNANLNDKEPILSRYWDWLRGVLTWNWGKNPRGGPVNAEFRNRIWVSVRLITGGYLLGVVIGVFVGAWTATKQYKLSDRLVSLFSFLILAVPVFVLGITLQILATKYNTNIADKVGFFGEIRFLGEVSSPKPQGRWAGWLDRFNHLLLPTITLGLAQFAFYNRIQRNLMLDNLNADYVRTAQAKGLTRRKAVFKHALRTSLIPTGTYFAFSAAAIFTGATFTERIFGWHGMGEYAVLTINNQDVNGVAAVTAFSALCVLAGGLFSEILVAILDPRVRQ